MIVKIISPLYNGRVFYYHDMLKILRFTPKHIDAVTALSKEFDEYLGLLSQTKRKKFDTNAQKMKLLKYGFGKEKSFSGYIAKLENNIVWYALFHPGFDPDEMQWKVLHLIDFFVSETARRNGVWKELIKKLLSKNDIIGIYFWVWKKNETAIKFYTSLWSEWCVDVPYMKLMK